MKIQERQEELRVLVGEVLNKEDDLRDRLPTCNECFHPCHGVYHSCRDLVVRHRDEESELSITQINADSETKDSEPCGCKECCCRICVNERLGYTPNFPAFGGGGMTKKEMSATHERWYRNLTPHPEEDPKIKQMYEEGKQCGGCAFFDPLDSGMGMDWGSCGNEKSAFDGRVVFEHHACPYLEQREENYGTKRK